MQPAYTLEWQHEKVFSVFTSTKEVMFSLCLFVFLLAGLRKNYSTDFLEIRRKGGTGPRNPLGFGGNLLRQGCG